MLKRLKYAAAYLVMAMLYTLLLMLFLWVGLWLKWQSYQLAAWLFS